MYSGLVRISIHAPARGATRKPGDDTGLNSDFNPRPREGGDIMTDFEKIHSFISIHAPARGATKAYLQECRKQIISIHAPARGATSYRLQRRPCCRYFNPRPREGGDARNTVTDGGSYISIHAPARGATSTNKNDRMNHLFQSTPPRGGRPFSWMALMLCSIFQSTPPRGGRPLPGRSR